MRRRLAVIATVCVLSVAFATPTTAITNGKPDAGDHPYVGLVGTINLTTGTASLCSGTLIAENVMLTAGHCTKNYDVAWVWFGGSVDPDQTPPSAFGTPIAHPGYDRRTLRLDVGVVLLGAPPQPPVARTAVLPAPSRTDCGTRPSSMSSATGSRNN